MHSTQINDQTIKNYDRKKIYLSKDSLIIAVFLVLSFSTYLFSFNLITLGLPILFLFLCSVEKVLRKRNTLIYSAKVLLSKNMIGVSFIIPIISLVGFILSEDKDVKNIVNFFMIYAIGISSQIILIDSKKVLETIFSSLYTSGVFCIFLYFIFNFKEMFFSLNNNIRFTNYSFHFNLIAYIVAGFSGPILFQILSKKNVVFNTALFIISNTIIIAAQSRGSLFAMVIGIIFVLILYLTKNISRPKKNKNSKSLKILYLYTSIVFLCCLFVWFYFFNSNVQLFMDNKFSFFFETINTKLELSTEYRGLGTGLTGRTDVWNELIKLLNIRILAFGNGYRTYTDVFEAIDNGYLVVIYENGLLCLLILLASISSIMVRFINCYMNTKDQNQSALYISYLYLMMTFLANNFVARFLLSVGNPFSAFVIIILFSSPMFLRQIKSSSIH